MLFAPLLPLLLPSGAALAIEELDSPDREPSPKGINLRYHYLNVPEFILDLKWFPEEETLAGRPKVWGHAFGAEFTIERFPGSFQFYAEYWHIPLEAGYFDDKESPPKHDDGDWIDPQNTAAFLIGVNAGHEFAISDETQDVWVGLEFAGGIGFGPTLGRFHRWLPGWATDPLTDCLPDENALVRRDECPPDTDRGVPVMIATLDALMQLKFHFGPVLFRIDAGFRPIPTVGGAAGGVF